MGVTNVAEVGWALTNQECEGAWLRSAERNVWAWSVWRRGLSVWAIWVCEMGRIWVFGRGQCDRLRPL